MAVKIVIPRVSQTMVEGILVAWTARDGSDVSKNDAIADVEGEKTTFEIKAPANGILRQVESEGQTLKVGKIIGFILQPGESIPDYADGDDGEENEPDETPADQGSKERQILASPATRRLAKEKGVDLALVTGTGKDGRITDQDVLDWANKQKSSLTQTQAPQIKQIIPLAGMRGTIAREMVSSLHTAAQLTAMVEMDAGELVSWYREVKATRQITYTDCFIKAVALGLRQHPILNAHVVDNEIQVLAEINISIAVAVKGGLVAPVVRCADEMSLADITQQTRQLVQKAHDGKLAADEMAGGTFAITNVGMHGIDFGTPILIQPQVAILAIGRIVEKPAVRQGSIIPRAMVSISLTYDHRVTDGVPPAEFLRTLADLLQKPSDWAG